MPLKTQKDILEFLRSHQDEMVATLKKFTNEDSPSTSKEHMDRFSDLIARTWEETGAKVTMLPQEKYGNHVKVEWGSGKEQILVLCHMDTVWGPGETTKRPFRTKGDKAYGPGVYDMKGGIVEALFAVKALSELQLTCPSKVVILHNSDEEIGSPSSRPIIEAEAKKSKAALVLEPSARGGTIKTWRKGVGMFEVHIRGRAAHAGADYEKGISAATEAAHQILYLHSLTNLEEGTTVNVGTVQAGTRRNVVAEEAILGVDLRVKTMEAADKIVPKILNLKPVDTRVTITVEGGLNRPPMERTSRNLALFRLAKKIGSEVGIDLAESGTGGGSDGNFTAALGIPTLDGLGPVGDHAHAVGEYLFIPSLPERASIVAGLLLTI